MSKRTFGNVYKSRKRWRVRYSIDGTRYDITGGDTQEEAEAVLARITADRARDRFDGRPMGAPLTLEDFLEPLLAIWKNTLRPMTLSNRRRCLEGFLDRLDVPMRDVRPDDANAILLGDVARGLKPSTVETYRRTLSAAWGVAVRMRVARSNPWQRKNLSLPTVPKRDVRRCSPAEVEALYAAAPPDLILPIMLWRECGLRRNEARTLLWGSVAGDRGAVTVRAEVAKSHRERTVPTTARMRDALLAAAPALPSANVCPVSLSRLNHGFREVADGLGLEGVTPHSLRHTYGFEMAEAGVTMRQLRDLMGHSSVTVTEMYAASTSAKALREAVARAERHRMTST